MDMSSQGRDVDSYRFTTNNRKNVPYIEWNDSSEERKNRRCATLATKRYFGLNPEHCNGKEMNYVCEYEGEAICSKGKYL